MGILSGLVSPLLTQTANARGSYLAGQRTAEDKGIKDALQQIALKRQAEQDALGNAFKRSQMNHFDAQTYALEHPKETPEPVEVVVGPNGTRTYVRRSEAIGQTAPSPSPDVPSGTVLPGAPGQPPQLVVTHPGGGMRLGQTVAVPEVSKDTPGGRLGGLSQNMQARLLGAVSEGRLADERMSAFEPAHMKNGQLDISIPEDIGAALNTGLAGAHNATGITLGRFAGGMMNKLGKGDIVQYQRDARLIARAEQLMSARGGSEAMASDNAFLAQGAAHAPEATVRAAQKSRKALFGKMGAVIQTLSPEQLEKLNAGLAALEKDDPEFAQKSNLEQTLDAIDRSGLAPVFKAASQALTTGPAAPAKPSNLATLRAAAEAALKAQGKSDAEILQLLGPPED